MSGRSPKRKRTSKTSPDDNDNAMDGSLPSKHKTFTQWSLKCGVEIQGVAPAALPGRGIGLVTTQAIRRNDRLMFIPGKAMFKPDTPFLKSTKLDANVSPQAQLAISALKSFHDDKDNEEESDSGFRVWQATWPSRKDLEESLPMCWPRTLRELLPPTAKPSLERVCADYKKDWAAVRQTCAQERWGQGEFRYFWMIVNSRSFHWCASTTKPGTMVMCPFVDYTNHGPSGRGCSVSQSVRGYEVVADRDYEAGTEILATYGAHSNDKLLVHYGFVLSETATPPPSNHSNKSQDPESPATRINTNIDDSIPLDHLILPKLSPEVKSALLDVGYLGNYVLAPNIAIPTSTEASPETTPLMGTPELCFKTQVAVRAALQATNNEWEYFAGSGEDLGEDRSGDVERFVGVLLKVFRKEAETAVEKVRRIDLSSLETAAEEESVDDAEDDDGSRLNLEDWNGQGAKEMIVARWMQIIEVIDRFCEHID